MLGYLDKEAGPETLINKVFKTVFYWTIPLSIYIVYNLTNFSYTRTFIWHWQSDRLYNFPNVNRKWKLWKHHIYESIKHIKASLPGMDLARSFVLLLGTFYSFNVQYQKNGKSFFTFMKAVLMDKSHEAKKRVVVNKLLQDLHAL